MKTRILYLRLVPTIVFCLCVQRAPAVVFDSELEIFASDARPANTFGKSVAISGTTAAVWSVDNTSNGVAAVYIFDRNGTNWVQTQKIVPQGGFFYSAANTNVVGKFVGIDGDELLIGTPSASLENNEAFVYVRQGGTWVLQQKLDSGVIQNTFFGASVAIDGDTAVVGAPLDFGAAFVFARTGTNWFQQAVLTPDDPIPNTSFGRAVAIKGDTVMVGRSDLSANGSVYVFTRTGSNWVQQQRLFPGTTNEHGQFGSSIAMTDSLALIGSPFAFRFGTNIPPENDFGAAYLFSRSGSTWTQLQELIADPGNSSERFGWSVDLSPQLALIGAPGADFGTTNFFAGAAYVFQPVGSTWVQMQRLLASQRKGGDAFGWSVELDTSALIIGAPFNDEAGNDAGSAYIFTAPVTPPVITNTFATPSVLFPPNHKLVPVTISVVAQGAVSCRIISVSSNEPVNGRGDGNTSPDWVITGDLTVLLRAERSGQNKNGRVYNITVQCTDAFGNTATTNVDVTVPHDRGNN